jgi:hypothetical protein
MPEIKRTQAAPAVGATAITENKIFRERLIDRFAPSDYVRVKNVDNEDFQWKWMPAQGEDTSMDDGGQVRIVMGRESFSKDYRSRLPGNERFWEIPAGEEDVLVGDCAYLFIEGLYKRLVAKKAITSTPNLPATQARQFNWTDGTAQEQLIDQIFLGIEQPTFGVPTHVSEPDRTTATVVASTANPPVKK